MTFPSDARFYTALAKSRNMLVPWYLMASYGYYIRDESLLSDHVYDALCEQMADEWPSLTHMHKHLINPEWLSAGTCFLRDEEYPLMAKSSACGLLGIPLFLPPRGVLTELELCAKAVDDLKKSCGVWQASLL
jgi:hypothetical protein